MNDRHATASDALRHAVEEFVPPDTSFKGERLTFSFKWFDMWIGIFWDTKNKYVYICPIPMFVFRYYYGH